jgi:hypothetical protein
MTKGRPPKELLERRKEGHHKPHIPSDESNAVDWKFWSGMAVAVVGILLAVLGLWLAVEDRPTVSLGPLVDATNLLSTQVIIVNNGVLPLRDVSVATFLQHALIGGREFTEDIGDEYQPPTRVLMPGEPITTDFSFMAGHRAGFVNGFPKGPMRFDDLDVALIVTFRPTWAPLWTRTRAFRFKSVKTSGGTLLQQVPAEDIESEYRKQLSFSPGH